MFIYIFLLLEYLSILQTFFWWIFDYVLRLRRKHFGCWYRGITVRPHFLTIEPHAYLPWHWVRSKLVLSAFLDWNGGKFSRGYAHMLNRLLNAFSMLILWGFFFLCEMSTSVNWIVNQLYGLCAMIYYIYSRFMNGCSMFDVVLCDFLEKVFNMRLLLIFFGHFLSQSTSHCCIAHCASGIDSIFLISRYVVLDFRITCGNMMGSFLIFPMNKYGILKIMLIFVILQSNDCKC